MNKNVISALLVLLFMVSCFTFFSVSATEEEPSDNVQATVETTEAPTTTKAPTTTIKATTTTTTTTTATTTTTTTTTTTKKTKAATVADPVYTRTTTTTTAAEDEEEVETEAAEVGTKETKEIQPTEEETEPTTAAKNVVDYGSRYRPLKWLSLVVMLGCIAALVAVNVRYRKKYGKPTKKSAGTKAGAKRKPQLDTSARFTPMPEDKASADENLDKTAVVDLSSFSKKPREEEFKPKLVDDDFFGEKKRKDEDNLFSSKKNEDDDLYI